jgi:hypothetical protein
MEGPLSPEEVRHLLPSDLISVAIGADYLDDPPTRSSSPDSPYKFGEGDLPPIESRIFQYLFYTTKQREQSTTLSLRVELDFTAVAASLQSEVNGLMGRRLVLLMKSINLMNLADEVSSQVHLLRKSMTMSHRVPTLS